MVSTFYSNLRKENEGKVRIKVVQDTNSLDITVLDNIVAWRTHVNEETINQFATLHKVNFNKYFTELQKYLKEDLKEITIRIENNDFILYKASELTIRFFHCKLETVIVYIFRSLLFICNFLVEFRRMCAKLYRRVSKYKHNSWEANRRIEQWKAASEWRYDLFHFIDVFKNYLYHAEVQRYRSKLELTIKEHEDDEKKLYGSFILLLNEKKKRIQFLTETLESFKANKIEEVLSKERPAEVPDVNNHKQETISDTEYETEDEQMELEDRLSTVEDDDIPVEPSTSTQDTFMPKRKKRLLNNDVVENKKFKAVEVEVPEVEKAQTIQANEERNDSQVCRFDSQELYDDFWNL